MEFIKGLQETGQRAYNPQQYEDRDDDDRRAEGSDSDDDDGEDLPEDSERPMSAAATTSGLGSPEASTRALPSVEPSVIPRAPLLPEHSGPESLLDPYYLEAIGSQACVVREPPEPPPRGQLVFHTDFESSNLGRVVQTSSGVEYELYIRPDTMSPKHRLWFYFGVSNCLTDQRVLFTIVNFSKARAQYRDGLTPLVRSKKRPVWQRLPTRNVFYFKSTRHKAPYLLSFVFTFDDESDTYEFAFCHPYTYTELQADLASLRMQNYPHLKIETLARSAQLRRIDVLTISDPTQEAREVAELRRRRPVVFITARVHPGETPSSHAMKGLIQFLVSSHPNALTLRKHVTFVLVPMLNPDGVALGNYRTDSTGVDLNRFWNKALADLEPSNHAVLGLLRKIRDSKTHSLDVFLDLHAHSSAKVHFCLCNGYDPASPVEAERNTALLRIMEAHVLGFSFHQCVFDNDSAKEGCARRVVAANFPRTLAYTLELSYFASRPTPYDDVIMAAAPSPPPQGYHGSSLTFAMNNCPSSSVALPYYNHLASNTLSATIPATSYANQPGSGASFKGRSGAQFHPPPGYVLDINCEQGYYEIGRGLALSIGHFYELRLQPIKSSLVHAALRQQQTQAKASQAPTWNSSPNLGALYNAPHQGGGAGGPGYAGRRKALATATTQIGHSPPPSSNPPAPPGTASAPPARASGPGGSLPPSGNDESLENRDRGLPSPVPGPLEDDLADHVDPGGSRFFRSAGRLLQAGGRAWQGVYNPLGVEALNVIGSSDGHLGASSSSIPLHPPGGDGGAHPPTPTPSAPVVLGPMVKGQSAPVISPMKSPSRPSLLSKPLRTSSSNRKNLRPLDDETLSSLSIDGSASFSGSFAANGPGTITGALGLHQTPSTSGQMPLSYGDREPNVLRPATSLTASQSARILGAQALVPGSSPLGVSGAQPSALTVSSTASAGRRAPAPSDVNTTPPPPAGHVRPFALQHTPQASISAHARGDLQDLALVPSTTGRPEAAPPQQSQRPNSAHLQPRGPAPPAAASSTRLAASRTSAALDLSGKDDLMQLQIQAQAVPGPQQLFAPHPPPPAASPPPRNHHLYDRDDPLKINGITPRHSGSSESAPDPIRSVARAPTGSAVAPPPTVGAPRLGGGFNRNPSASSTVFGSGSDQRSAASSTTTSKILRASSVDHLAGDKAEPSPEAAAWGKALQGGAGPVISPALLGLHHQQVIMTETGSGPSSRPGSALGGLGPSLGVALPFPVSSDRQRNSGGYPPAHQTGAGSDHHQHDHRERQ